MENVNQPAYYFDVLAYWSVGNTDKTFEALRVALEHGFSPELIRNDPDFRQLQSLHSERFERLFAG